MEEKQSAAVVIGFGNTILRDDGIGVYMAEEIAEEYGLDCMACSMYGLEIIEKINGYDYVFILDSIKVEPGQVGQVFQFEVEDFKGCRHMSSPHSTNFAGGLEVARELELAQPDVIAIFGIGINQTSEFGTNLTADMEQNYNHVFNEICEYISGILPGELLSV